MTRETRFYCGACAAPVYRFESYPLCALCAYEQHVRLLREARERGAGLSAKQLERDAERLKAQALADQKGSEEVLRARSAPD